MFESKNTYVFMSKLVDDSNLTDADKSWINKCNNKVVKIIDGGYLGVIEIDGVEYKILRKWTKILDPKKVNAFLKATNQINPNN